MKHAPITDGRCFIGSIILLCICIGMLALGASVTLWDPQTEGDTFTESLLEGFSIAQIAFIVSGPLGCTVQGESSDPLQSLALTQSLFRPPRFS
jgi:hypothetical protein